MLHATLAEIRLRSGVHFGDTSDFARYRRYCTRRLRRLRRKQDEPSPLLSLNVLLAERAWAYAMELKESKVIRINSTGPRRSRQRLVKAVVYANRLKLFCGIDETSLAGEINAYVGWLKAQALESRGDHKHAALSFDRTRMAYVALATSVRAVHSSTMFLERAADCSVAMQRCIIFDRGQQAKDMQLDDLAVRTGEKILESGTVGMVRWCGSAMRVPNDAIQPQMSTWKLDKEPRAVDIFTACSGRVGGLCLKYEHPKVSVDVHLEIPNEAKYEKRLQQLEDLTTQLQVEFTSTSGEMDNRRAFELVQARATYEKLNLLYQRCDALVAKRARSWRCCILDNISSSTSRYPEQGLIIPDDIVHLLENLIQVTSEIGSLAGIRDAKDEALAEALDARALALKAYRCHFLAETYGTCNFGSSKAKGLLLHSMYLADRARQEAEACEAAEMNREMLHISNASGASGFRLEALHYLRQKKTLGGPVCNLPAETAFFQAPRSLTPSPQLKMIKSRAVLYNLCHNHLTLPAFEPKKCGLARRRLFGWFHGRG